MKQIPLTQGKFALVDDEWFDYLMQWKWRVLKTPHAFYAIRNSEKKTAIYMHRVILGITEKKIQADHVSGDGLDNRKINLRVVTPSQNLMNRCVFKNSPLGIKGVQYYKYTNKYTANIGVDGVRINLGYFKTLEEAVFARNGAEKKYHGEFSVVQRTA